MKKLITIALILSVAIFARPENAKYINGEWYTCKTVLYDREGSIEKIIDTDSSIMIYDNSYIDGHLVKSIGKSANPYYYGSKSEIRFNSCGDTVYVKKFYNLKNGYMEDIEHRSYKYENGCKIKSIFISDNWDRNENGENDYNHTDIKRIYSYSKNKTIIKEYKKESAEDTFEYNSIIEKIYSSEQLIKEEAHFSSGELWYSKDYKTGIFSYGYGAILENIEIGHNWYNDFCSRRIE